MTPKTLTTVIWDFPVRIFNMARKGRIAAGYDADILVVDPRRSSTITNAEQVSRAGYTPFDGWRVKARLTNVFLRGHEIVRDGVLVSPRQGQVVRRDGGS